MNEMNKSAKEMFKDLGFTRSETPNSIIYTRKSRIKIKFLLFYYKYIFCIPQEVTKKSEDELL